MEPSDHPEREPLKVLEKHYGSVVDIIIQSESGHGSRRNTWAPDPEKAGYGDGHSEPERDSQTLWSLGDFTLFSNY